MQISNITSYSLPNSNIKPNVKHATVFTGIKPNIATESKLFSPFTKLYDKGTEKIAKGLGKIMDTSSFKSLIEATKRNKWLFQNLMTFNSILLSGMYIRQTLKNKDLDEEKRKTLAINQATVLTLSTIMCYTLDNKMNNKVGKLITNFEATNSKLDREVLEKCTKGIGLAKSIMIFDMIYRFITPVIVTPIANHIGNKINEKKQAKEQAKTV